MGKAISTLEKRLRALFPKTGKGEESAGFLLAAIMTGGTFIFCKLVLTLLNAGFPPLSFAAEVIWCWQALAVKNLRDEALRVQRALENESLDAARQYQTPVLRTSQATSDFSSELVKYLKMELAPRVSMHGVLVEVNGEGILILGESGVGKSETALEIVKRGHRLIADDQIEIRKVSETTLLGRAPDVIKHLIEIRGIGILDVKELYGVSAVKQQENIDFVINLELWDEKKTYDRLGLTEETTDILGIKVPSVTIPVGPGRNLAIIVEAAAINYRVKKMGYNAAQDLVSRVFPGKSLDG